MADTAPPARTGRGNPFTTKLGPAPMWAWLGGGAVLVVGYSWFRSRQNAQAQAAADTTPASDVPQFVNQTYTTVQAPQAPSPTASGTSGGGTFTGITPVDTRGNGGLPQPVITHPKMPVRRPAPPHAASPIFNATYTVKKGETLATIAKKYKITVEQLAHANGLGTGAGLRTGQKIRVPSPGPGGKPNKAI